MSKKTYDILGTCYQCGKSATIECWQVYNPKTGRHDIAKWCSLKCLHKAEKMTIKRYGEIARADLHNKEHPNCCAGELPNDS